MKKKKNTKNADFMFVKSITDAQFILKNIFKDYSKDTLIIRIYDWLEKMQDPTTLNLFLRFPELLKDYSLEDFLNSDNCMPEITDRVCIRNVGLAGSLIYMICICWEVFGNQIYESSTKNWPIVENINEEDISEMKDLLAQVRYTDFQQELSSSVISIVGKDYLRKFTKKVGAADLSEPNSEGSKKFENDPELSEHMQLMLWHGLMRFFLGAVYFYFGEENTEI